MLYLLLLPVVYIVIKLILFWIIRKFGKFSYEGFSAMGFAYDAEKNMFYSTKNAWQKVFGYCHLYDVLAPLFRMIIDTEPIRFYYNKKNWLITFWKGQYGIVTGAEIGIYNTSEKKISKKTIYFPAREDEMLNMSFVLYKKGKEIMRIKARHWWLAIFKLGVFSKPKDITMDIKIVFPNKEMLNAFLCSFKKLKHNSHDYKVVDNEFCFVFKKPRTRRVWTRCFLTDTITQLLNKKNVNLYNKYLADAFDDNRKKNNKKIMLSKIIPNIFKNPSDKSINDHYDQKNVVFLNAKVFPGRKDEVYETKIK